MLESHEGVPMTSISVSCSKSIKRFTIGKLVYKLVYMVDFVKLNTPSTFVGH